MVDKRWQMTNKACKRFNSNALARILIKNLTCCTMVNTQYQMKLVCSLVCIFDVTIIQTKKLPLLKTLLLFLTLYFNFPTEVDFTIRIRPFIPSASICLRSPKKIWSKYLACFKEKEQKKAVPDARKGSFLGTLLLIFINDFVLRASYMELLHICTFVQCWRSKNTSF